MEEKMKEKMEEKTEEQKKVCIACKTTIGELEEKVKELEDTNEYLCFISRKVLRLMKGEPRDNEYLNALVKEIIHKCDCNKKSE